MKIRILTIQDHNYGNRLQNYALQEVLKGLTGLEVETYRHWYDSGYALFGKPAFFRARKCLVGAYKYLSRDGRWLAFEKFDRECVRHGGPIVGKRLTPSVAREASRDVVCVIGSDQVWNPQFGFTGEMEYAPFIPKERTVAYAPSFGVSQITERHRETTDLLNGIAALSVRELSGAHIVRELTGREAPVVLDPTMLLEAGAWQAVSREPQAKPAQSETPFCLRYMLGTSSYVSEVDGLCSERGLSVVDLGSPGLAVGPAEFLWLVRHARLVCTDSYHAAVFSLLFHTPFAVFERGGSMEMSDRIATLDGLFDLAACRWGKSGFDAGRQNEAFWRGVDERLEHWRVYSREWLAQALNEASSHAGAGL